MSSEVELERMVMRLIGDAESYLAMLKEAEEGTEETADKVEEAGERIERYAADLENLGKQMSLAVTAPLAAMTAVATAAYAVQENAEITLRGIMQATDQYTEKSFADLQEFASGLQLITTTGDEAYLEMLRTSFALGLTAEQAKVAAREAKALAAAVGMNARSAGRYTAALAQGETMMLNRYLPSLRLIEDQEERVAEAHRMLGTMFAVAEAEAESFGGRLQQLKNVMGDVLQEEIGQIMAKYLKPLIGVVEELVRWFHALPTSIKEVVIVTAGLAATVGPVLLTMSTLAKILPWLATGLKAYSFAALAAKIQTVAFYIATQAATVAAIAFKAMAGPKGWLAIAGGLTVATGAIMLYRNRVQEATKEAEESGKGVAKMGGAAKTAMDQAAAATDGYAESVRNASRAVNEMPVERQQFLALSAQVAEAEEKLAAIKKAFAYEEESVRQQVPGAGTVQIGGMGVGLDIAALYIEEEEQRLNRLRQKAEDARQAMMAPIPLEIDTSGPEDALGEIEDQWRDVRFELQGATDLEQAMVRIHEEMDQLPEEAFAPFGGAAAFFEDYENAVAGMLADREKLETQQQGEALIEQFATPFEIAQKKIADYKRMLDVLGEEQFGETFRRATKAAIDEYENAVGGVERIQPEAVQTIRRGSVAEQLLIQESRLAMSAQEPSQAQEDSRKLGAIANATAPLANKLDVLNATMQSHGLEAADLGGMA